MSTCSSCRLLVRCDACVARKFAKRIDVFLQKRSEFIRRVAADEFYTQRLIAFAQFRNSAIPEALATFARKRSTTAGGVPAGAIRPLKVVSINPGKGDRKFKSSFCINPNVSRPYRTVNSATSAKTANQRVVSMAGVHRLPGIAQKSGRMAAVSYDECVLPTRSGQSSFSEAGVHGIHYC